MKLQTIVSDVRNRVETAGKHYQDAFKAYFDAQRKAVGVVTKNGQTLANTEIGAAKNIYAAAKASFDKARNDGVRKIANNPQAYVPNGRDQIVSAYKDTIDLLVKTGNELGDVVFTGYKSVVGKLSGEVAPKKTTRKASTASKSTNTSASAGKSTTTKTTAAKRKTTSTRSKSASSTSKRASGTSASTGSKRSTTKTKASSTGTKTTSNATDSGSSAS